MDAQPKYRGARSLLAERAEGIYAENCSEVNFNFRYKKAFVETEMHSEDMLAKTSLS